jgi:hypothetical protein
MTSNVLPHGSLPRPSTHPANRQAQSLLGSLYLSEDQDSIRVFYGLELLEVVPAGPEHPAFKMMVGRLANAKVRIASLEDVFNVDRKTIRSWGKAILSRDLESLARILLGRGVNQKRTPAIDKYVVRRWAELRAEGRPDYRAALAKEIENIFEVKLSGETLRQIVNEFKGDDIATPDLLDADGTRPLTDLSPTPPNPVFRESTCWENTKTTSDDLALDHLEPSSQATSSAISPATDAAEASKCSPPNWQPQPGDTILCDHVGMLIFASSLATNPGDNDFYYDPHTAHYTGMQQVLKGWCAAIRWADKLINSDYHFEYIHRPWAENPAIRQIIVRATNPKSNTVQLSVLTDGN